MSLSESQKKLIHSLCQKAVTEINEDFSEKLEEVKIEGLRQKIQPGGNRFRAPVSKVMAHRAATLIRARADVFFKVINDYAVAFTDEVAGEVANAIYEEARRLKAQARKSSLSDPSGAYEAHVQSSIKSAVEEVRNDIEIRRLTSLTGVKSISPPVTHIHVAGVNARVNVGSTDNSVNRPSRKHIRL